MDVSFLKPTIMRIFKLISMALLLCTMSTTTVAQERTFGKKDTPQKPTPMMGDMLHVRNGRAGKLQDVIGPDAINRVRRLTIEGMLNRDDIRLIKKICDRSTCKSESGRTIENYVDLDLTRASIVRSYGNERDVIADDMFSGMDHLRVIKLPEYTQEIGRRAFYDCDKLKAVYMPDGVKVIDDEAFYRCERLEDILLSRSLKMIGKKAFMDCKNLKRIHLPASVETIGQEAFKGCGLTDIRLNSNLSTLGWNALADNKLREINIPRGTHIDGGQPGNSASLQQISIEQGNREYTSVGGALYDYAMTTLLQCPAAKTGTLSVPAGVSTIAAYACASCAVSQIILPASVSSIEKGAFMYCANLQSMTVPEGVSKIEDATFKGCKNLRSLQLPASLTAIGNEAMQDCKALMSVNMPETLSEIGAHAFQECGSLTTITLPTRVTKIPASCFRNCNGLLTVSLHDGITSIGDEAFRGCLTLRSITLPHNLQVIGDEAFRSCSMIQEFVIPAAVTQLGSKPFTKCEQLQRIVCLGAQPPKLKSNGSEKVPLYVPRGFAGLYKKEKNWKKFKTIIEQ